MTSIPPVRGDPVPALSLARRGSEVLALPSPAIGDPTPVEGDGACQVLPVNSALPVSRTWPLEKPFQKSRGARDSTVFEEWVAPSSAARSPAIPPAPASEGSVPVRGTRADGALEVCQGGRATESHDWL